MMNVTIPQRILLWQAVVGLTVCAYILSCAMTGTLKSYHWLLLIAIPGAVISGERGRRFFIDLAPLFIFWFVYDRLRLLQPLLYHRVAVELPYAVERWAFGWMSGGEVPALASRAWLAARLDQPLWSAVGWAAQMIYLSHLYVLPLLLFWYWIRGQSRVRDRQRFVEHIRTFTALHALGIAIYLLVPVAPPWWVGLHGMATPTPQLIAQTHMSAAMDGVIVQHLIRSASQWFGAIPSLHGAYPVLFLMLAVRGRSRLAILLQSLYLVAMWVSTVILNQHYIIDLLIGALVAAVAYQLGLLRLPGRRPRVGGSSKSGSNMWRA